MCAQQGSKAIPDFTAISLKRLHSSKYRERADAEWLPRRAAFEVQIGPYLGFSRVWREVHVEVESGPEYLYRYFPFLCYVYVDGRPETVLEFGAPHERRTATVRIPVGVPVNLTVISELAHVPQSGGHGTETRELALRFIGVSSGDVVTPSQTALRKTPHSQSDLEFGSEAQSEPQPIFVIGSYRSATSVLTWALGQHPNIWPMEESGWIAPLLDGAIIGYRNAQTAARGFFDVYDIGPRDYFSYVARAVDGFCRKASQRALHAILLGRLSGKAVGEYNEGFQLARSMMNPKRRWVDGTPEYSGYTTILRAIFPLARFVAIVRDPLDVVASMLRFERAGGEARSVADAAQMWLEMMRAVLLSYRALGPQMLHLLHYDRVIESPASVLRDLFDFLGEPNFPKAADTFADRINSSNIGEDERAALYAQIDSESDLKAQMADLYREILAVMASPWRPSRSAEQDLLDAENDRIMRVALEYRGGAPLPMMSDDDVVNFGIFE